MNLEQIRQQFPSLSLKTYDRTTVFFDNAAGTQATKRCIDRITDYFLTSNANTHGLFETSRRSDQIIDQARLAVADFISAPNQDEVAFGANMTTLTQSFARAFARSCKEGDEIVTTALEHEANISPWLALQEHGIKVRFADINENATINLDSLRQQINSRTKLVAIGLASNAFGTINPVAEASELAHKVGAVCFVDAVHYSPHGSINLAELGCDVLVYSPYKSFGPHAGVLWGKREVLDKVKAYHLRTVAPVIPDKFETGTQNHEAIAGILGSIEYLETLSNQGLTRRERLQNAFLQIKDYEEILSHKLMDIFEKYSKIRVYGITNRKLFNSRVPTFAIRVDGLSPQDVAEHLAKASINVWSGNYYALEPMTRLGLETSGGAVRISLVHYNSQEEIDYLEQVLKQIC
ncbi:MAG: cysteine desulfurase-like protein [Blastocatellia bacterium]|nr:cysteine desulfurase-like protein [Blastocatellia bacterium]